MTLKFSESPSIQVKEVDLTGIVPGATSTTGAIVGDFNWGPVDTPVLVGNESELAAVFGSPTSGDAGPEDFISASYFLKYSSSLYVVRASGGQTHATHVTDADSDGVFETIVKAKYPGSYGNSIKYSVCDAAQWSTWSYSGEFSSAPVGDEVHVIVYSGTYSTGEVTILEKYEFLQTTAGAQTEDGSNNYVLDVVNGSSAWVEFVVIPATTTNAIKLTTGSDGSPATNDFVSAYDDAFGNKDELQVDFLIPPASAQSYAETIHVALADLAKDRADCVAVVSPKYLPSLPSSDFYQLNAQSVTDYVALLSKSSSYLIVDGAWLKVYDKYNDKYIEIPAASSTAGVMAATDAASAPWFSPAGSRRGQYLGVTDLVYNPSKTDRDVLYKAGVNPVVNFTGQGIMLYGDKTHMSRPSAFDRINVRRLFLVLERAISRAAESVMFEFNDDFTRAEFVNIVEPFLREVQGRRGITDFRVVCDETNNTPEVVDRNEFVASCFIKPARSINYVTLNFVAVRSGVSFDEVVGTSGV